MRQAMQNARKPEGYVLVSTALLLVVLCGFAALALDVGVFMSARASAQRAADAAALAGAFTFVSNQSAPQPATAQNQAMATAGQNRILDQVVAPAEVSVAVDVGARRVTVNITRTTGTFFARALQIASVDIGVQAIAEASANATGSGCSKPWFIPNTILSGLGSCNACAAGEVIVSNGQTTAYARGLLGMQLNLKPNNPADALAPGQFFAVAMGDSRGGADYRTNIATCSPQSIYCQSVYDVEPGNKIGPTVQGVRDLMGGTPDVWVSLGQYQHANGTISDTSPQLIVAPIWNECAMAGFCPSGQLPDGGRNVQIGVIGFAQVFLEGIQGNNVIGRLVGVSACPGGGGAGGGGGAVGPPETGPYAVPVRLVRLP